jgi:hypothetical protein
MYRFNPHRRMSIQAAFAVLVALLITTEVLAASSFQSPPQNALANPLTQAQNAQPQFQPTPEDIGDSMIAHQRYQSAIEAYKKAPRNSLAATKCLLSSNQKMPMC